MGKCFGPIGQRHINLYITGLHIPNILTYYKNILKSKVADSRLPLNSHYSLYLHSLPRYSYFIVFYFKLNILALYQIK